MEKIKLLFDDGIGNTRHEIDHKERSLTLKSATEKFHCQIPLLFEKFLHMTPFHRYLKIFDGWFETGYLVSIASSIFNH